MYFFLWRGTSRFSVIIISSEEGRKRKGRSNGYAYAAFNIPLFLDFLRVFSLYRARRGSLELERFRDNRKRSKSTSLPRLQTSRESRTKREVAAKERVRHDGKENAETARMPERRGWWSRRLYFISYAWNFWIPRVTVIAPRGGYATSLRGSLHSLWIRMATGHRNRDISARSGAAYIVLSPRRAASKLRKRFSPEFSAARRIDQEARRIFLPRALLFSRTRVSLCHTVTLSYPDILL